jgi:hypothetical protein
MGLEGRSGSKTAPDSAPALEMATTNAVRSSHPLCSGLLESSWNAWLPHCAPELQKGRDRKGLNDWHRRANNRG